MLTNIDFNSLQKKLDMASSPEEIQEIYGYLREIYKSSLFLFCKYMLGFKDLTKDTHSEVIRCLQRKTTRKLVCLPRGCLKSTIACVGYPVWRLVNNPDLRILIDSELYTNSVTFIREIKLHLDSPKMIDLFGQFKGPVWNTDEIIINQRVKKLKEASIVAGGIGTTKVGQHFDLIIGDDYNSQANTNSIENAEKVLDHYKRNISILEPDGTYVIIGTRYHTQDVIGHILSNEDHNYEGLQMPLDNSAFGATKFAVGTSTVIRVIPTNFVTDWTMRILVGGGTLEIVPPALSGSSTSTGNWGVGYAVGTSEVIQAFGPATVYLSATGATMTVGMALRYSAGVSLL